MARSYLPIQQPRPPRSSGTVTGGDYSTNYSGTSGSGYQSGPAAVAPSYDRATNSFVYVEAESVDGQQLLEGQLSGGAAYAPGSSTTLALDDLNVDYVRVEGHGGVQQPVDSNFNQQDVRASQEILPGTTMETNFGTAPKAIKEAAPPPEIAAPAQPAAPASRPPANARPNLRRRRNSGGLRVGGRDASSVADFSLGGLPDINPLSIRSQR